MDDACQSRTRIEVAQPDRVLRRLCKHFSHKVKAEWNYTQGRVDFGTGICQLQALGQILHLNCIAANGSHLREIEETLERHLAVMAGSGASRVHWSPA